MSEPKSGESDLHEAFVAFSNEVFGATQRLLSAQQQLAQEILSGASRTGTAESGQQAVGDLQDDETDRDGTYEDVDEDVDDAADEPEPEPADDAEGVADDTEGVAGDTEDAADDADDAEDVADEDMTDEDTAGEDTADEDQSHENVDQDVDLGGLDDEEPAEASEEAAVITPDVGSRRSGRGRRR